MIDQPWAAKYVPLLAKELSARGIDPPKDELLQSIIEGNAQMVAAAAGITERDARLTINPDAVPAWADLLETFIEAPSTYSDDEDDQTENQARIPMATAAKVLGALYECAQMYRHHAETQDYLADEELLCRGEDGPPAEVRDDLRERVKALAESAESCDQLAMYLTTTLATCPFTSGDVVVAADFVAAVQSALLDAIESENALVYDELLPGWFCRQWDHKLAPMWPFDGCGQPAHSLEGIIETATDELSKFITYIDS